MSISPRHLIGAGVLLAAAAVGMVMSSPQECATRDSLPDPACTPGVTDPAVTQSNITTTICLAGYSAAVRPPVIFTDPVKVRLMRRYGRTGAASDYELDHLIALELGGGPQDERNLWPQPRAQHPGASEKDRLENILHREVCAGRMPLAAAQRAIASDWRAEWERLGRP